VTIRPVIRADERFREQFIGATKTQARRLARRELEVIGEEWEAEVRNIVAEELPRRDGVRHKPNTTHLENSFTHQVIEGGDSGFPMLLDLTTKPGVSAKKVAALNHGIDHEYEITATNAEFLRWGDAPGDITKPFQKTVTWRPDGPNSKGIIAGGYHFMERARDAVLARRRRRR
jgi:hypothetical protein